MVYGFLNNESSKDYIYIYIERERERVNRSNMHTFTKWVVEKVNKDNICWSLLKTKIVVVN